jgi:ribosome recycling factor
MTKEELIKKIKETYGEYSQEKKIKLLKELKKIIEETNSELRNTYNKTKDAIDKEKAQQISKNIQE